mgnify:CR=1 FL=1
MSNKNVNYDILDKILSDSDNAGRSQYGKRVQRDPCTGKEIIVDDAGNYIADVDTQLSDIEKYLRS